MRQACTIIEPIRDAFVPSRAPSGPVPASLLGGSYLGE